MFLGRKKSFFLMFVWDITVMDSRTSDRVSYSTVCHIHSHGQKHTPSHCLHCLHVHKKKGRCQALYQHLKRINCRFNRMSNPGAPTCNILIPTLANHTRVCMLVGVQGVTKLCDKQWSRAELFKASYMIQKRKSCYVMKEDLPWIKGIIQSQTSLLRDVV